MADIKKIKVNKPLKNYQAGEVVEVNFDNYAEKTYWKRRLEDAKIDQCCELVKTTKKVNEKIQ